VVKVGRAARYVSDFNLTTGRVGKLAIDYVVQVEEDAVAELTAKVFGRGNDEITIQEKIELNGENAKGLIKTRVAIEHEASKPVSQLNMKRKQSSQALWRRMPKVRVAMWIVEKS
jgi:uncharacterized protein YdbL (DUF1318 family)